ncbi:MAG: RluA family pseudouridine synthase [Candidatus Moranbacteria bacterium]|nr:RluA family pseudouridine synthase [Candidatus Moranbacteria bacterium]
MTATEDKKIQVGVRQGDSGRRLDSILAESVLTDGKSRTVVRLLIESGNVTVNGEPQSNPAKRLRYGDIIGLERYSSESPVLTPNHDLSMTILFENDQLLAIAKPAGVQMHPAGNDLTDTVSNWVIAKRPDMASVGYDPLRPGIVHRLDRNTSGVVVLAKTPESFNELQELFRARKVKKTYQALVLGNVREIEGIVSYPLAHRTGTLRRQAIVKQETEVKDAKEAVTEYRVKQRYREYDLLEVFPKTGRTHQIRVHLAAIGHPVVGDRLYGGRRMKRVGMPERQLLHSFALSFTLFGIPVHLEAPLPPDFSEFVDSLDGMKKAGYPGKALN